MADYVWPITLPQRPHPEDYLEEEPDNVISQDMGVGPPKKRKRSTAMGTTLQLTFIFTRIQLAIFKAFYRDDLGYGALPYEWVHPETFETSDFVFQTRPQYRYVGDEITPLWSCSFKVYQKP